MSDASYVFSGTIEHETERAYLVVMEGEFGEDGPQAKYWIPKSQIIGMENHPTGTQTQFLIPEWLAMEKGLL